MKLLLQTDLRAKNTCCPFSENSKTLNSLVENPVVEGVA